MRIALCGSMTFAEEMRETAEQLSLLGHVSLFPEAVGALNPSETPEDRAMRKAKYDLIRRHWAKIRQADAVLVLNYDKNGVPGYVGGNTFLEMGFAHVLRKPIYLLNPIPDLPYAAEMKAMSPIVLRGEVERIAITN